MAHFAVTAVGRDKPGIVAAVSGVLKDAQCSIEDSSMSILRGHFAMMLIVDGPEGLDEQWLETALQGPAEDFELVPYVRLIGDDVPTSPDGDEWTVSVYGADKVGIVHEVTKLLAEAGVNITNVTTRLIGEGGSVYAMLLDVTLPAGVDPAAVQRNLDELGAGLGVECAMHPSEADIL